MSGRTANIALVVLILGTLIASLLLYPYLPDQLPIHWNWQGKVDGWADKSTAAFMIPAYLAISLILMHLLPRMTSGRYDIQPFEDTFRYIWVLVGGLFAFIHTVMLASGLYPAQEFGRILLGGLCVALALMGNLMGKVRRNPWVGIRTPWTLASDEIWIPVHRLGARLMFAGGFISALAIGFGAPIAVALWIIGAALLIPVVYSYVLFTKLESR